MYRHAIGVGARFKLVSQAQFEVALVPGVWVVQRTDLIGTVFDQHFFFKAEQV
ncbi:hypothetical protein D3C81_1202000 [compost metagenome]